MAELWPRLRRVLLLAGLWLGLCGGAMARAEASGAGDPRRSELAETRALVQRIYAEHDIDRGDPAQSGCTPELGETGPDPGPSLPGVAPWFSRLLLFGLLALMLVPLLALLLKMVREAWAESGAAPQAGEEVAPEAAPRAPPRWRVDLSHCRALAADGRFAEAVAALHRATLLGLERAGYLLLERSVTNWEYVRRLAGQPELQRALAEVTEAAEAAVLGDSPPGAERYGRLEALVAARLGGGTP